MLEKKHCPPIDELHPSPWDHQHQPPPRHDDATGRGFHQQSTNETASMTTEHQHDGATTSNSPTLKRHKSPPKPIIYSDCNGYVSVDGLQHLNLNDDVGATEASNDTNNSNRIMGLDANAVFALSLVAVVLLFVIAFVLIYWICRKRRNKELYVEQMQEAVATIQEGAHHPDHQLTTLPVVPPKDGNYKGSYYINGVAKECSLGLQFSKLNDHSNAWVISGEGLDSRGRFTITEGFVNRRGDAYWAQRYCCMCRRGHCLSSGQFDLLAGTFSGHWYTERGTTGPYVSFAKIYVNNQIIDSLPNKPVQDEASTDGETESRSRTSCDRSSGPPSPSDDPGPSELPIANELPPTPNELPIQHDPTSPSEHSGPSKHFYPSESPNPIEFLLPNPPPRPSEVPMPYELPILSEPPIPSRLLSPSKPFSHSTAPINSFTETKYDITKDEVQRTCTSESAVVEPVMETQTEAPTDSLQNEEDDAILSCNEEV
ncbi:hypothetical protein ACA910_008272 [Epithemia clementina (nom. ined.)]